MRGKGARSGKSGNEGRSLIDFSDAVIYIVRDEDNVGRADPIDGDGGRLVERCAKDVTVLAPLVSASGNCGDGVYCYFFSIMKI